MLSFQIKLHFAVEIKSLILDDPTDVNPENQDKGADDVMPALIERHQDSDSDSDSDSDDEEPHAAPAQQATHDAGASHAEAPQQGASHK